jgi:membrane protein implicated in regulation of membrane protease activity
MLWTMLMALVSLWFVGLVSGIGGSLIHALLAIVAALLVIRFLSGQRTQSESSIQRMSRRLQEIARSED